MKTSRITKIHVLWQQWNKLLSIERIAILIGRLFFIEIFFVTLFDGSVTLLTTLFDFFHPNKWCNKVVHFNIIYSRDQRALTMCKIDGTWTITRLKGNRRTFDCQYHWFIVRHLVCLIFINSSVLWSRFSSIADVPFSIDYSIKFDCCRKISH